MKKIMLMEDETIVIENEEDRVVVRVGDTTADITEQFEKLIEEISK